MITVATPQDPELARRLAGHPFVQLEGQQQGTFTFQVHGRTRQIKIGEKSELMGIVELMDNNPLVCADEMAIPDAAGTLALIALGPVILSGAILVEPTLTFSFEPDPVRVRQFLQPHLPEVVIAYEVQNLRSVCALHAMVEVDSSVPPDLFDALFDEAYGRSFYVHKCESDFWDIELVESKPVALYQLRYTPGDATTNSLLTIQVMADKDGKCGSAQVIHAMNVMAGLEECVGIE